MFVTQCKKSKALKSYQTYIFIRFVHTNNYKSENTKLAFLHLDKISESSK